MTDRAGPLVGIRVVELAGLGAVPYAGRMLSDMGADVIRVDRPGRGDEGTDAEILSRGRRSVAIDLKDPAGLEVLLHLIGGADVLMEGYRPGVAERLGFGPDVCRDRNPRLVYGRMSGWGQAGPLAHTAGHDLNYLALSGTLRWMQGDREDIVPTLPGLVSDIAGGGLMLAFGITAALVSRSSTGRGQVVDAAMIDGVASVSAMTLQAMASRSADDPAADFYDGRSPYYALYWTSDGERMAVAAVEPQFYAELVRVLGLDAEELGDRDDPAQWPAIKRAIAAVFATRTQREWTASFEDADACVTPVLDFASALAHPHIVARGSLTADRGSIHPAPAPRFSDTPTVPGATRVPGRRGREVLAEWGWTAAEADDLITRGVVR